jgi:hypothetical protein
MPLFNESLESIAQAVVTVKRALKAGVIDKADYKGLSDYLAKRSKDFKIKKAHLVQANKDLDEELLDEELEFFVEEGDALYKMAEELLEEFGEDVKAPVVDLTAAREAISAARAAWMKMDDTERAAMAAVASEWR